MPLFYLVAATAVVLDSPVNRLGLCLVGDYFVQCADTVETQYRR